MTRTDLFATAAALGMLVSSASSAQSGQSDSTTPTMSSAAVRVSTQGATEVDDDCLPVPHVSHRHFHHRHTIKGAVKKTAPNAVKSPIRQVRHDHHPRRHFRRVVKKTCKVTSNFAWMDNMWHYAESPEAPLFTISPFVSENDFYTPNQVTVSADFIPEFDTNTDVFVGGGYGGDIGGGTDVTGATASWPGGSGMGGNPCPPSSGQPGTGTPTGPGQGPGSGMGPTGPGGSPGSPGKPGGGSPTGPTGPGKPLPCVPEPATWGLMLVGFGVIGVVLRSNRRRVAV